LLALCAAVLIPLLFRPATKAGAAASTPTRVELPEKRTEFSRTYRNPDGSLTTELSQEQLHFKDGSKGLAPIDTRLKTDGDGYKSEANSLKVALGTEPGRLIALSPAASPSSKVTYGPLDAEPSVMAATKVSQDKLSYRSYRKDADLEYELHPGRLKESIVLAGPTEDATFTFSLALEGLKPVRQPDGSIALVDGRGKAQMLIERPYMTDSSAGRGVSPDAFTSMDVTMTCEPTASGGYMLIVAADKAWLDDPARKYPVRIDPTFVVPTTSVADTWLNEAYPSNNYGTLTYMTAGSYAPAKRFRSLVKFDISAVPQEAEVTTATLSLTDSGSSNINIDDYDGQTTTNLLRVTANWTETGATWSNMAYNYSGIVATTSVDSPVLNVTSTVRDWLDGTYSNHGFMLSNTSAVRLIDDAVPSGATISPNPWPAWVSSPVHSGSLAHNEPSASGTHQHFHEKAGICQVPDSHPSFLVIPGSVLV